MDLKQYRYLIDMHHKDGDKSNNSPANKQYLCRECHQKKHSHYKVEQEGIGKIRKLQKEQEIG